MFLTWLYLCMFLTWLYLCMFLIWLYLCMFLIWLYLCMFLTWLYLCMFLIWLYLCMFLTWLYLRCFWSGSTYVCFWSGSTYVCFWSTYAVCLFSIHLKSQISVASVCFCLWLLCYCSRLTSIMQYELCAVLRYTLSHTISLYVMTIAPDPMIRTRDEIVLFRLLFASLDHVILSSHIVKCTNFL